MIEELLTACRMEYLKSPKTNLNGTFADEMANAGLVRTAEVAMA